ncbi:hypothetical protein C1752_04328 [Acaryochloris thomasi RCC1774]|uniref:Uncharacterized protein n=2 Tax=Acaryochloris TaxID=155977 RepID=A0A2W1JE73_9CYAN|nr:hypothetical protein C1752_04328 [Acaryochloris thomasi RCC1774]
MAWLQAVYRAATMLDSGCIDRLLAQVPAEQKLQQAQLQQIADSSDFDRLATIVGEATAE